MHVVVLPFDTFCNTILVTKTTVRKYSPRKLRELSATSFCAAVVFVRCILCFCLSSVGFGETHIVTVKFNVFKII